MNTLSWLIYLAQVSHSFGAMLTVFGVAILLACCLFFLVGTITNSVEADSFKPFPPKVRYVATGLILCVLGNLTPDRETIYAIAASEIGERAIQNDAVKGLAGDATKALQQWIKRQIEPESRKSNER